MNPRQYNERILPSSQFRESNQYNMNLPKVHNFPRNFRQTDIASRISRNYLTYLIANMQKYLFKCSYVI